MHGIGVNAFGKVGADRARLSLLRIGCAHQSTVLGNGILAFENLIGNRWGASKPAEILVSDKSLASLFKKINYCTVESDVNGYYKGPKFSVTGTASKPENNLLQVLVGSESNLKIPLIDIFK